MEYDTSLGPTPNLYFQSWAGSQPTINTGANGLASLDFLVSQAESAGLKLLLTLTKFVSHVLTLRGSTEADLRVATGKNTAEWTFT